MFRQSVDHGHGDQYRKEYRADVWDHPDGQAFAFDDHTHADEHTRAHPSTQIDEEDRSLMSRHSDDGRPNWGAQGWDGDMRFRGGGPGHSWRHI